MGELHIRRVDIDFTNVPFLWHPERPRLSRAVNGISWAAVVFERRLCRALSELLPRVEDAELAAELRLFIAQEATHSRLHRAHLYALVAQHPSLDGLLEDVEALAARHLDLLGPKERLVLGAVVENKLAALGRYLVHHRETLFESADVRVAALLLWHFCEEIEHRSTLHVLHEHLRPGGVRNEGLRVLPRLTRLCHEAAQLIGERFAGVSAPCKVRLQRAWPGCLRPARFGLGLVWALVGNGKRYQPMPAFADAYLDRIRHGLGPVEAWTGASPVPRSRTVADRSGTVAR